MKRLMMAATLAGGLLASNGAAAQTFLAETRQFQGQCPKGWVRAQGQTMKIHETLFYVDARHVQLQAQLQLPSGPLTIAARLQWQGACLPGMMPGDEGSIVNGTFSKADNINDLANR